eukprot:c10843_g1_i1.p1 GENE.c10843_g1_i1~~c10843_g1_i1.p1  ORF type:complete len:220 (+),score=55.41 c10843_g1_i1:28-660(+)
MAVVQLRSFPELASEEQIRCEQPNVTLWFDSNRLVGTGALYITTQRILWRGPIVYQFDYPGIVLHAISNDITAFPTVCIYCQTLDFIDASILPAKSSENGSAPHEDEADQDDEEEGVNEIRFCPQDASTLQYLYNTITECSSMNPDPAESEDDEGEMFANIDTSNLNTPDAILTRLENILTVSDNALQHNMADQGEEDEGEEEGDEEMAE